MTELKLGEIVHCNITLRTKDKAVISAKEIIIGREYEKKFNTDLKWMNDDDRSILRRCGITDKDAHIIDIEIIKSLGFKVKSKDLGGISIEKSETEKRMANGTY